MSGMKERYDVDPEKMAQKPPRAPIKLELGERVQQIIVVLIAAVTLVICVRTMHACKADEDRWKGKCLAGCAQGGGEPDRCRQYCRDFW